MNRIMDWLQVGLRLKRWLVFGILGFLLIILGITEILGNRFYSRNYQIYFGFLILSGIWILWVSINEVLKNFVHSVKEGLFNVNLESRQINSQVMAKKYQSAGPRIVAIGGGTGLSTMLRGLKYYTSNLTAVVTVGDDGGGSGTLRDEMGMLPPGDIRNCLVALANTDSIMEELMQYRFPEGSLKNQSFGNLFLAALTGVSENFEEAVVNAAGVLAITGRVLPVTLEDLRLTARMKQGNVVTGESNIGHAVTSDNPIDKLSIHPQAPQATKGVLDAIAEAELIVLGPGSLFTSILPNLLIPDVSEALRKTSAVKVYICNVMTQPGETDGFTVTDHLKKIMEHVDLGGLDYVVVNNRPMEAEPAFRKYLKSGSRAVQLDRQEVAGLGITIVEEDVVKITDQQVRHDPMKLADTIYEIAMAEVETRVPTKIMDYIMDTEKNKQKRRQERLVEDELKKSRNR